LSSPFYPTSLHLAPLHSHLSYSFFFFNDTATTEIYTLSLHDALPIYQGWQLRAVLPRRDPMILFWKGHGVHERPQQFVHTVTFRSEEHTSELQSLTNLVCRLLLEKKKKKYIV